MTALDEIRENLGPHIERARLAPNHYEGCWKDHWPCAVSRLLDECERLKAQNAPPSSKEIVGYLIETANGASDLRFTKEAAAMVASRYPGPSKVSPLVRAEDETSRDVSDAPCLLCGQSRLAHRLSRVHQGMFDPRMPAVCPEQVKSPAEGQS